MDQEENKLDKIKYEKRCPGVGEFLAYVSVVVLLLALLIPIELKYGFSPNLYGMLEISVNEGKQFPFNLIKQLGLFKPPAGSSERIFSKQELAQFTGEEKDEPIYLAYLGNLCLILLNKQVVIYIYYHLMKILISTQFYILHIMMTFSCLKVNHLYHYFKLKN